MHNTAGRGSRGETKTLSLVASAVSAHLFTKAYGSRYTRVTREKDYICRRVPNVKGVEAKNKEV